MRREGFQFQARFVQLIPHSRYFFLSAEETAQNATDSCVPRYQRVINDREKRVNHVGTIVSDDLLRAFELLVLAQN